MSFVAAILIGGPMDGEVHPIKEHRPSMVFNRIVASMPLFTPEDDIELTEQRDEYLNVDFGDGMVAYVHSTLTNAQAMQRLLDHYRPPRSK
jgi:hypothetical protein